MLAITAELVKIARASVKEALVMAQNTRRSLRRAGEAVSGRATAPVAELEQTIKVLEQVMDQTRLRLNGETPDGSTRVVSRHDTEPVPSEKAASGAPWSSGTRLRYSTTPTGSCSTTTSSSETHQMPRCSPPPSVALWRCFRRAPSAATADRGYGEASVDEELQALGVKTVVIARKGRATGERQKLQMSKGFLKLVKWRTGSEGRISHLKHAWGWNRTLIDGIDGARLWCGWGVLAHNATKIAALIEERERDREAPQPTARGPCRPPPTKTAAA